MDEILVNFSKTTSEHCSTLLKAHPQNTLHNPSLKQNLKLIEKLCEKEEYVEAHKISKIISKEQKNIKEKEKYQCEENEKRIIQNFSIQKAKEMDVLAMKLKLMLEKWVTFQRKEYDSLEKRLEVHKNKILASLSKPGHKYQEYFNQILDKECYPLTHRNFVSSKGVKLENRSMSLTSRKEKFEESLLSKNESIYERNTERTKRNNSMYLSNKNKRNFGYNSIEWNKFEEPFEFQFENEEREINKNVEEGIEKEKEKEEKEIEEKMRQCLSEKSNEEMEYTENESFQKEIFQFEEKSEEFNDMFNRLSKKINENDEIFMKTPEKNRRRFTRY